MTNAQVAAIFEEMADILEFQGANPFRVRAYRNAGRTIESLTEPLAAMLDQGRDLTQIDGVGDDLAAKIQTLLQTGELPQHKELCAAVPESVLALMRIPGVGPKKAAVLHKELSIQNLEMLKEACEAHKVRELKGFGAKTEEQILKGLSIASAANERMLWADADDYAQEIVAHLKQSKSQKQIEVAGSYRRGKETIGDLDILVESADADEVMDRFSTFSGVAETIARGDTKMSVRLARGLQVDLRVVQGESFGAALQYFTGNKEHNVELRGRAKSRGLKINEYGVFKGEQSVGGQTEAEVYKLLDLPWIPPELREHRREFDWAEAGELPHLIELADIRGDLHMHTTETDGKATLEQMVEAARGRGLSYIAITDHSKRVSMANGMNGDRLRRQWAQIDELNGKLKGFTDFKGFTVLKGVEVDILEKGPLDLDDDVLAEADWVVASVHYGQNQPREQITKRILGALENPHVCAIAHPTGRLLNRREPYQVDMEAVFDAAKRHGKLLELNANPQRLDLNDVLCAAAKERGIPIVISTDAHSIDGLNVMRYGILQARRAGLTKADVANTRPWLQMKKLIGRGAMSQS